MVRTASPDSRREDLASAAARVIARAGMSGANLRDVAAEAGLTTGALTHYFADKRELLIFTLRASTGRRAKVSLSGEGTDALRSLLLGALPITDDARLHWVVTLAFCAQAANDEDLSAIQRDFYRHYRGRVLDLLEAAVAAGRLRSGIDVVEEADRLIALVDGIALQAMLDADSWPPDRQVSHLDAALDALTV